MTKKDVTPEMIEAGVDKFLDYDPRFESGPEDTVVRIFLAMLEVQDDGS